MAVITPSAMLSPGDNNDTPFELSEDGIWDQFSERNYSELRCIWRWVESRNNPLAPRLLLNGRNCRHNRLWSVFSFSRVVIETIVIDAPDL